MCKWPHQFNAYSQPPPPPPTSRHFSGIFLFNCSFNRVSVCQRRSAQGWIIVKNKLPDWPDRLPYCPCFILSSYKSRDKLKMVYRQTDGQMVAGRTDRSTDGHGQMDRQMDGWIYDLYNCANFIKTIWIIKHVGILYLLALILIFRSLCPFSFWVFYTLVTWLVKYGRD